MTIAVTPVRGLRAWVHAARPPTLSAAVVPVLVGTALATAQGHFHPAVFLATLGSALLIQIGANYANDYSDFKKGADTPTRVGPLRIASAGVVRPETVRRAAALAFVAAGLLGLYLISIGGWPILIMGVASIVAGAAYTGGRFAFGYHGLGDAVCFLFFGLVAVAGTYYLQTQQFQGKSLLPAIPVGCLVTAVLVVNNIRDAETDAAAGKRTLAVILGRTGARAEYVLLVAIAYLCLPVMPVVGLAPWWLSWLPVATIPFALSLTRIVGTRTRGRFLNVALKGTARLHLVFGILLSLSLLAART